MASFDFSTFFAYGSSTDNESILLFSFFVCVSFFFFFFFYLIGSVDIKILPGMCQFYQRISVLFFPWRVQKPCRICQSIFPILPHSCAFLTVPLRLQPVLSRKSSARCFLCPRRPLPCMMPLRNDSAISDYPRDVRKQY